MASAANSLYNTASGYASSNPYHVYSGATSAAENGAQTAATNYAQSSLGTNNSNLDSAATGTQNVANSINTGESIQSLMNPYAQSALAPTLQSINDTASTQRAQTGANAAMNGAFGGSAQGVQSGLIDKAEQQNIGNATAQGMNTAYNNAQQQQNTNTTNALSANNQLANIGSTEQNAQTSLASLLGSLGAQQQSTQQQGITNDMTVNQQANTGQMGQYATLASLLSGTGALQGTSSTGSTTQPDNSGLALLGSLL